MAIMVICAYWVLIAGYTLSEVTTKTIIWEINRYLPVRKIYMPDTSFEKDIKAFIDEELIDDVVGELKSGKEATVYLAHKNNQLLAIKHYRPMLGRHFANAAKYREGRFMKERDARAFVKRSRYGRQVAQVSWIKAEYSMIWRLHNHKLPVPKPIAHKGTSILMEFIADKPLSESPADRLIDVQLTQQEAKHFHVTLMRAIVGMMKINIIHADLSAYNILVRHVDSTTEKNKTIREPVIIDFPQAVDPRSNKAALELLEHDVNTITQHLQKYDKNIDQHNLVSKLWNLFTEGKLG